VTGCTSVQPEACGRPGEVDRSCNEAQNESVDSTELQNREDQAVSQVIDRLAKKFPDRPRSVIENIVGNERHLLDGKPIRDYIPVLIEHGAKARLRQSTGHGPSA
jgi:hypothetical protein